MNPEPPSPQPLRPEQQRALQYLRAKGTEAPAASIRERVREAFGGLEALLAGIPEEAAKSHPLPGKWSVHEVVDHLAQSHRPAARELRDLLQGRRPEDSPIPAGLQSPDAMSLPWTEAVRRLGEVHAEFLAALDQGSDSHPLDARAPVIMVVKAQEPDGTLTTLQWTEDFDWKAYAIGIRAHTLEHRQQIERTLDAGSNAWRQAP